MKLIGDPPSPYRRKSSLAPPLTIRHTVWRRHGSHRIFRMPAVGFPVKHASTREPVRKIHGSAANYGTSPPPAGPQKRLLLLSCRSYAQTHTSKPLVSRALGKPYGETHTPSAHTHAAESRKHFHNSLYYIELRPPCGVPGSLPMDMIHGQPWIMAWW